MRLQKTLIPAMFAILASSLAVAQTQSFNIGVTLLSGITIVKNSDLSFGSTEAGSAQTVTVAPTASGASSFSINGAAGNPVTVGVSSTSALVICTSPGCQVNTTDQMTVDTWTYVNGGAATLPADGSALNSKIGGTLHIAGTERPGTYQGSATLSVTY